MEETPSCTTSLATEEFLVEQLLKPTLPISQRFRALFSLRNLRGPGPREALISATKDTSNLLAHEAAFALGQMQDPAAVPALKHILEETESFHPIVRHEAAEALGAIGQADCVDILKKVLRTDPAQEVKETCSLALRRLEQSQVVNDVLESRFLTIDPAMPAPIDTSVAELRKMLLDENLEMYDRYAALFALRNEAGMEAVRAIIAALGCQSALLKHEELYNRLYLRVINWLLLSRSMWLLKRDGLRLAGTLFPVAYVLGQLQNKEATAALTKTLTDVQEHPMVRHEAAEALGSIADKESLALLCHFQGDSEPIVAQSCEVALSMLEFEQSGKSFEYLYLETPKVF